jgi:hypothetical protein
MLANWVGLALIYAAFGLLISVLARGGWDEDWEESLLASVLAPPLFALIAAALLAQKLLTLLGATSRGSRRQAVG